MDNLRGMFNGKTMPDEKSGYALYQKAVAFNTSINLNDTVRVNENFYIGKQWEGVESNGLPTPQFNFLKRVVGFIVATITTDNIKVNASALAKAPQNQDLIEPTRIVNEEFEALTEQNKVPALMREYARNAAVDGDGCLYTYWDAEAETGQDAKGMPRTEVIENTRVFFGNPNDRIVQRQPWIIITRREEVRKAKLTAKENGISGWQSITSDSDNRQIDSVKETTADDKVTVFLLLWRDEESGTIWSYEFTQKCALKKPEDMEIKLYPLCWLNWDYVQDCYHGQAMITGLIPNQIFVNKIWAASQLSFLRTAYPKVIYDKTKVRTWDNRIAGAIGVAGDPTNVATVMQGMTISPQIAQFIELAVTQTEESLGATSVALGDTRPDNTSAIIALQRAASTPTELTKQNLYQSIEDLFRIYLEFMANYYGKRAVGMPPPDKLVDAASFAGQKLPDEISVEFDYGMLKTHPMTLKLDVGASSYYSEIASMQTLDNLLQQGRIDTLQYLERIPDGYIPARRALIAELKQQQAQMAQMQAGMPGVETAEEPTIPSQEKPEIPTGGGFSDLQRKVLATGTTEGLV